MVTIKYLLIFYFSLIYNSSFANAIDGLENIELNENFLLLGDFNAISLYNSLNKYNLSQISSTNSLNVYQLSNSNNSIQLFDSNIYNNSLELPSIWQLIDNDLSLIIFDNIPYFYNLSNQLLKKLDNWNNNLINGKINTIYYDDLDNLLYFGGSLSFNNTFGIIQYNIKNSKINSLPFGGFNENSIINSIIYNEISDSFIFSGYFNSIGYSNLLNITYNSTITNQTIIRNSSSITDISQKIQINSNDISATSGKNYKNIICPTTENNGWILQDSTLGSWSAILQNELTPSKIRLYNSNSNLNAVNTFRVITYPANGIMNLSYIDPLDFTIKYCDAFCPLSLLSTLESSLLNSNISNNVYYTFINNNQTILEFSNTFQDFGFVNSIDVTSFTVQIMEYYGDYSELLGIELYNDGISVYANNSLNLQSSNSNCLTSSNYNLNVNSEIIGNLNWNQNLNNSYLFTNISTDKISNSDGIRYNIYLPVSGTYSILMYTSGCLNDNSCNFRGIVKASIYDSFDKLLSSSLIYQNNEYEKYDVIYTGNLNLESDTKPIYIEMNLFSSIENNEFTYFIADSIKLDYIQLELNEITGNITTEIEVQKSGLIELNGIFEYSPSNFSNLDIDYPIGNTSINIIGKMLNSNATINEIIHNDTSLIISGDFNSTYGNNIFGLNIKNSNNLTDQIQILDFYSIENGTNGNISNIYGSTNEFLIVGDFDNFNNLTSTNLNSFSIDGSVIYFNSNNSIEEFNISNSESIDSVSGFVYNNTDYLLLNLNDNSTNIVNFDSNKYLENSTSFSIYIASSLETAEKNWEIIDYIENSYVLGSIVMYDLSVNNIIEINNNNLNAINVSKNSEFISGVYIGNNEIITGGSNLYLISNDSTSELSERFHFDDNTFVTSLMWYNSNLFFAINSTGRFHTQSINGLGYYNINNSTMVTLNNSFSGYISDLTVDPQFDTIIGVGNFSVGDCNSICIFEEDFGNLKINQSVSNVSGIISSLNYYNLNHVLIGGDFTINNDKAYFGIYNTQNNSLSSYDIFSSEISSPVKKFLFGDERKTNKTLNDVIIVMGSNYIGYFNNSNWNSISDGLDLNNAQFTDISLLNITDSNDYFYNSQILLLTGKFNLINYGLVSSAIWNGNYWLPYTITANDLDSDKAIAQSVVKMTSMYIYDGSVSSTSSSQSSSSTSSVFPTSSSTSLVKSTTDFTNGQVTGVGCALAVGTLILLSGAGLLYFLLAGHEDEKLEGLKLTGEDRMLHAEKMKDAVPPENVVNMN